MISQQAVYLYVYAQLHNRSDYIVFTSFSNFDMQRFHEFFEKKVLCQKSLTKFAIDITKIVNLRQNTDFKWYKVRN